MLQKELRDKGVHMSVIQDLMESYEEEQACKKVVERRGAHMDEDKLRAYLTRLGFNWKVINDCLK